MGQPVRTRGVARPLFWARALAPSIAPIRLGPILLGLSLLGPALLGTRSAPVWAQDSPPPAGVEEFVPCLDPKRGEESVAEALHGLESLQPAPHPDLRLAVRALIELLRHDDESFRLRAHKLLVLIGADSISPLGEVLRSDDASLREPALGVVIGIAKSYRYQQTGITQAHGLLASLLGAEGPVALAAEQALGELPGRDPYVIAALKAEERQARQAAARLLRLPRNRDGVAEALLGALSDRDLYVRREAARSLAKRYEGAPPAAVPALKSLLRDPDSTLGDLAAACLAKIGAPAFPSVVETLADPDPELRRRAARALTLSLVRVPEARPGLLRAAQDPSPELRQEAISALGNEFLWKGSALPLEALGAALADPDPEVVRRAIRSLRDLGPRAAPVAGDLARVLQASDPALRLAAAKALGSVATRQGAPLTAALELLGKALSDDSPDVRAAAASVFGALADGAYPQLPALVAALDDPDPQVRHQVQWALKRVVSASRAAGLTPVWVVPRAFWKELSCLFLVLAAWFMLLARATRPRAPVLRFSLTALPPALLICVALAAALEVEWIQDCLPETPGTMLDLRFSIYPSVLLPCLLAAVWSTARSGQRIRAADEQAALAALDSGSEPGLPGGAEGQAPEHEQER